MKGTSIPPGDFIFVLDFGSQYTQLIARKIRELGVYSEIKSYRTPVAELVRERPRGIILSGGPNSVYEVAAPRIDREIFDLGIPILGICYGQQLMAHLLGGQVVAAAQREYGRAKLIIDTPNDFLNDVSNGTTVWMSHGDFVEIPPPDFVSLAKTENAPFAVIAHVQKKLFGVQFHPEVAHTVEGTTMLRNFIFDVCGCTASWTPENFIDIATEKIRQQVGNAHVVCGLSGGVDS
ncbi:MAG: glutamine-hydrolyzing GMP synthase, partial [candidate division KSB1 bacterium]|nr:glutamine-hydrolyzing GMP synthase [candidate division KSB1 bacterium]